MDDVNTLGVKQTNIRSNEIIKTDMSGERRPQRCRPTHNSMCNIYRLYNT